MRPLAKAGIFPLDVWSVKEYGVDRWLAEAPVWPLPDSESFSLLKQVKDLFARTIVDSPQEVGDALLVAYKLSQEYSAFLHALVAVERLAAQGIALKYSEEAASSGLYGGLAGDAAGIHGVFHRNNGLSPPRPSTAQRFARGVRALLRNYRRRSRKGGRPGTPTRKPDYLALNRSIDQDRYAASERRRISLIYPFPLLGAREPNGADADLGLDRSVGRLMDGLQTIAAKHGVGLDERHLDYLNQLTVSSAQAAMRCVSEIGRGLRSRERTSILVDKQGAILKRCVSIAGSRQGHVVVGFDHGHSQGIFDNDGFANAEMAVSDVYVVPTPGAAELYSRARDKYPLSARRQAQIVSAGSDKFAKLWRDGRRTPLPRSIERVMLLEFPMTEYRYPSAQGFWPYQLELSLRVASFLRKLGVRAVLKRHPDRLRESDGLYDHLFDEVLSERFESVLESADAYLFTNLASTTFGTALLTNRPVVLFETMLEDAWEDLREPLRKRCRVVPSRVDGDGRLRWDEAALSDALRRKPEEPDTELLERVYFP